MLPFEEGEDEDPYVVMSIIPELSLIFETRKRTPLRIVFKTVKMREIREKCQIVEEIERQMEYGQKKNENECSNQNSTGASNNDPFGREEL